MASEYRVYRLVDMAVHEEIFTLVIDYWCVPWTSGAMIKINQNSPYPWTHGNYPGLMGRC